MKARFREILSTYGLLSPWLLTLGIFWLYPLGYALYISFTKIVTLTGQSTWVGLSNYKAVFSDRLFWVAVQNTCVFAIGTVPVTTVLALAFAVTLNSAQTRWKDALRAVAFVPTVTSIVVISLIFTNLYARDGQLNALLGL
ncbi:MAG: carbohydrate ABC transporter permease, partial [Candidatus Kapaibacterium sp.]